MQQKSLTIPRGALLFGLGSLAALWAGCGSPAGGLEPREERGQIRRGLDGMATVSNLNTILNRYAALGADALRGSQALTLSTAAGASLAELQPLMPGDVLLVHQAQGADVDPDRNGSTSGAVVDVGSAGLFEFVTVKAIDSAAGVVEIFSNCGGLRNNYDAAGHVQVVRVPQYSALTVEASGSITAPPWNGSVGGVIALLVESEAKIDGQVNASAVGFRGGPRAVVTDPRSPGVGIFYASPNRLDGGAKGESIAGFTVEYGQLGAYGRGAVANGGGGGNRLVAGGGGGGNGGRLTAWNGQGIMALTVTGGAQAWPLDPGYSSTRVDFAGGGRGGYTASGAALDPTLIAPENVLWLQDFRRERGGLGGRPVTNDVDSRLFFGGGGGAGDDYQDKSGSGGNGGGLIFLSASAVSGSGQIIADGGNGGDAQATSAGAGGGGAGGTLVVSTSALTGVALQARGGSGGSQPMVAMQGAGPGGGGGGGFIAAPTAAQVSRIIDGGIGGTTASSDLVKFPRNGASDGAPGEANVAPSGNPLGTSRHCVGADLALTLTADPMAAYALEPVSIRITVRNQGPSAAVALVVRLRVPVGSGLLPAQPDGWDCMVEASELTCRRSSLAVSASSTIVVTLTPPVSVETLTITGEVAADAPDPDSANNSATLELPNSAPIREALLGGGLSCAVSSSQASGGLGFFALFVLALALLMSRRRLRA